MDCQNIRLFEPTKVLKHQRIWGWRQSNRQNQWCTRDAKIILTEKDSKYYIFISQNILYLRTLIFVGEKYSSLGQNVVTTKFSPIRYVECFQVYVNREIPRKRLRKYYEIDHIARTDREYKVDCFASRFA